MLNIVVVGAVNRNFVDEISKIVVKAKVAIPEEMFITYDPVALKCVDTTPAHKESPYLIVRDKNESRAMNITTLLNEQFGYRVETQILRECLPRKT